MPITPYLSPFERVALQQQVVNRSLITQESHMSQGLPSYLRIGSPDFIPPNATTTEQQMDKLYPPPPTPIAERLAAEVHALPPDPLAGLTIGRIVHYIIPLHQQQGGMHRAAIITNIWGIFGTVNLYVFPDASYPLENLTPTSITFDPTAQLAGQWHWPERA